MYLDMFSTLIDSWAAAIIPHRISAGVSMPSQRPIISINTSFPPRPSKYTTASSCSSSFISFLLPCTTDRNRPRIIFAAFSTPFPFHPPFCLPIPLVLLEYRPSRVGFDVNMTNPSAISSPIPNSPLYVRLYRRCPPIINPSTTTALHLEKPPLILALIDAAISIAHTFRSTCAIWSAYRCFRSAKYQFVQGHHSVRVMLLPVMPSSECFTNLLIRYI
ncbi:hypothetical protein BJ138DRAFT_1148104 [Hygrophoropsis aurantiaca]|uniref:Uncharacterized protein n=1 Tax=Hygrophoropsis aurantiaca TaxID=72124 RepID=A0ACB8AHZ0_9AGAM|nr:hypothetical protein BJ138DRAFT_1148104 [Hygrophoropsis aurantiaca]